MLIIITGPCSVKIVINGSILDAISLTKLITVKLKKNILYSSKKRKNVQILLILTPFCCLPCLKENIPFTNITNNEYKLLITKGVNVTSNDEISNAFSPSAEMQNHIDGLNEYLNKINISNDIEDDTDDNISPINCRYYSPDEFSKAKFNSSKAFSLLHLNIHSISRHIDSLHTLLLTLESNQFEFDIIAISESKLLKNSPPLVDINISN